jgi:hypothetical protein
MAMASRDDTPRAVLLLVVDDHELPLAIVDRSVRCDLALVDQILRLQLVVARRGWTLRLTDVDDDLRDLMHLVGVNERLGL